MDCVMTRVRGPLVVSVSGTSGAGKTTLVRSIAEALNTCIPGSAITLMFDDYASDDDLPEDDLGGWLERGGDPEEWLTPRFAEELRGHGLQPSPAPAVIVIEEPFGRARNPIGRQIDLALHIQLDLNVALARRLLREFVSGEGAMDAEEVERLHGYLTVYLAAGAAVYAHIERLASDSSDIVLDGTRPGSDLLADALSTIELSRGQSDAQPTFESQQ